MRKDLEVHPQAPAADSGMGYFRSALSTGLNQRFDDWFSPGTQAQQPVTAKKDEITIPSAPLWHMGWVKLNDSESSFNLLQNAVNHLADKGRHSQPFTDDDKEFMKELFEALWWGGKVKGMDEAAQLANHYVNGDGEDLEIDAEVYKTSVIVTDTMGAMKGFVRADPARKITQLKCSDKDFLNSPQAKAVQTGRDVKTHGALKSGGVLMAEQNNSRLKNADHQFYLDMSVGPTANGFHSTWRVDSVYDFEPFSVGYFTLIPLSAKYTLKLPDGLSQHLTNIEVAKAFKYWASWTEHWK